MFASETVYILIKFRYKAYVWQKRPFLSICILHVPAAGVAKPNGRCAMLDGRIIAVASEQECSKNCNAREQAYFIYGMMTGNAA